MNVTTKNFKATLEKAIIIQGVCGNKLNDFKTVICQ